MNAELLQENLMKAGRGDRSAFRALAKPMGQLAFALAMKFSHGQTALAEDITQDVLIKLWKNAPTYQPTGSVPGYVQRLTYTTTIDHLRKLKPTEDLSEATEVATGEPSAFEALAINTQQRALLAQLHDLPDRQKEAVMLTFLHEFPQQQVADTMNTSVKAVESLLIRAKRRLRDNPHVQQIWRDHNDHA